MSSAEGLRSPRPDTVFAALPVRSRVAVVGDSFAFGLEVSYEDTWAHRLEGLLTPRTQVLNFGVDGYGVDQAYLRYRRDVIPWHPDVVIFGLISDDMRRSMGVYGFLTFPGAEIPFPKPRLVVRETGVEALNLPLPSPNSIFFSRTIEELPFVEYDRSFHGPEWVQRPYRSFYLLRYLLSRNPGWVIPRPMVSDEAQSALNAEILQSFLRRAHKEGSIPIVVYFPSIDDFRNGTTEPAGAARQTLDENNIAYVDMTICVEQIPDDRRFVILHYSPETNSAIARCLEDEVSAALHRSEMNRERQVK
jgi:hypothetical protein